MTSSPSERAKLAREYLAERAARNPARTPSITFGNATTTERYTGNRMGSARTDADQHFNYSSAPMAAQIARAV